MSVIAPGGTVTALIIEPGCPPVLRDWITTALLTFAATETAAVEVTRCGARTIVALAVTAGRVDTVERIPA